MFKKIKNYIKNHKKTFILGFFVVIAVVLFLTLRGNGAKNDTYEVKSGDFKKTVSVSGKVVPSKEVDLSFESSGTISSIKKVAGDKVQAFEIIATLNASDLEADRASAEADLLIEKAELSKLRDTNVGGEVDTKKLEAVNAVKDAYEVADDAIRNRVDQFYDDPLDAPEIKYTFEDYFDRKKQLNEGRKSLEKVLVEWKKMADALTVENYETSKIVKAMEYTNKVKSFLNEVSFAVNSFEESTILSASTIEGYKSDVSVARTNISETLSDLVSVKDSLRGSVADIPIQEAKVRSAEAKVNKINAEIAKTVIRAPFSGIVTVQDGKVGKSVPSNEKIVGLISENFEIETFVPEVSIPGIVVGNPANITLDAYLGDVFEGTVSYIDPGETEKDGVSNYKVKIVFAKKDDRVKPGMTVDATIVTGSRTDVLAIPERAVLREGNDTFVFVLEGKTETKKKVTLGERDGTGNVEVLNGLVVGESISLNPIQ